MTSSIRIIIILLIGILHWQISDGRQTVIAPLGPTWQSKVDPVLLDMPSSEKTGFILFLQEQADLSAAVNLQSKTEKTDYVYQQLTQAAESSQPPVIAELKKHGVNFQSFWISNMVWVEADRALLETLARRQDVAHIYANTPVRMDEPIESSVDLHSQAVQAVEWGISKVNADDVWLMGFSGQDVIIGGQDTGYQWDHPALKNKYRGWDGISADHNYNWHDAIHSGGGVCGLNSIQPCDDHNHGTHTMGTMLGDDGAGNQIGMAPYARWIACRNMDQGVGTPTTYAECFQWFIAPTDLDGQNPETSKAPHVINNSWSCPPPEGCTTPDVLRTVVETTRAAGIVVVVSAGNDGSECSTVDDPIAIYDASFSIGATNSSDNIASFSSRGPVTADGSNRLKPDVSAPGVSVRSSIRNNGYTRMSGTSMAAPHVSGLIALLISAQPGLAGHVDEIEQLITQSATPRTSSQTCGGIPGSVVPNNTYGHGRIDALAAVTELLYGSPVALNLAVDDTPLSLSWDYHPSNCTYDIHQFSTPYLAPTEASLIDTLSNGTLIYAPANASGTSYFKVQTRNCDASLLATSNQIGQFQFSLSAGS